MSIPGILYAVAALLFLLAAFGAALGDLRLLPLGLAFLAAGLAVAAFGVGRGTGGGIGRS